MGGNAFSDCGIDGVRDMEVDDRRTLGGMANGGVVPKANGGEYDKGTKACWVMAVGEVPGPELGLNEETGLETMLVLELGRRVINAGFRLACSSSTQSVRFNHTAHNKGTHHRQAC